MRTTQDGADGSVSSPGLYAAGSRPTPAVLMALAAEEAPTSTDVGLREPPLAAETPVSPEASGPARQPDSRADVRRSLRAARRHRRHVMVGCAVVIAVCVILTVLIVSLARDRGPATQVILPRVAVGIGPTTDRTGLSLTNLTTSTQNPGATAPEGEHP